MHQSTKEGAGRYMLDQVDQLLPRGIDVSATVPTDGPLLTALAERNAKVHVVPNPWWTSDLRGKVDLPYGPTLEAARAIAAVLREWNVDVAYTHTVVAPAGAIAAAIAGVPHIWHLHEFSYNPTCLTMGIAKPELARLLAQTSNRVYFASNAIAADWTGTLPSTETRIVSSWTAPRVSAGAPDLADPVALELLKDEEVFVIAVIGSIHSWKRQADVVKAVGNLLSDDLNVALLVVGPIVHPGYADEITRLAAQQPNPERIRFCDYTEFPERVMRAANVCVVSSDREPFGRVTIESMAQGTPVVGTDSGGTPEIIRDGVNGLVYPTGDVQALTNCLRRLMDDSMLRSQLAAGALRDNRFTDAVASMAPVIADLESLRHQSNPASSVARIISRGVDELLAETPGQIARRLAKKLLAPIRRR
jgi:glycosyltransferase involved in cell wall biosynthesis